MNTHTQATPATNVLADFASLNLVEPLMQAVTESGYTKPTPIQAQSIPALLEGHDLLGLAQTGTGKTAAFVLPMLQRMMANRKQPQPKSARALILTPTRELAVQINDSIKTYGRHLPLRSTVIFGGVGSVPQINTMRRGVDFVVATPGRLLDLMNQGHVSLSSVEFFVLDEADRMLDMGFIRDIRKIVATLPVRRQTLLFSATMPNEIADLANSLLTKPKRVEVVPQSTTAERIDQIVYMVSKTNKRRLLAELLNGPGVTRSIVFTRTKRGADRVSEQLERDGIRSAAIHGNKGQSARQTALNSFRNGSVKVLVATDIAARGIDVDGISHVVNYDLPLEPESYVHRIGRTARAGATGIAISLCDGEERSLLRDIEKVVRMKIPVVDDHPLAKSSGGEAASGEQITLHRAQSIRQDQERTQSRGPRRGGSNSGGDRNRGGQARGEHRGDRSHAGRGDRDRAPAKNADFRGGDFREQEARQPRTERPAQPRGEARADRSHNRQPEARDARPARRDDRPRRDEGGESRFEAERRQAGGQRHEARRSEAPVRASEPRREPVRPDGEHRRIDYRARAEQGERKPGVHRGPGSSRPAR
ncbi:DEAD/DEAH box helicase [Dongia mobilis]|uniref:DEAD/DEAH box helicase n=1 Tax=Dongia sp. TaxID=1977262 RepID=UPI002AC31136